jgi:hypothetical protein
MMKLKIIALLSVFLLAAACQKRKYPNEKIQLEKEEMYSIGYIGTEPVELKIGKDGYYCYSSYKQRADSIYVFEGELKKYDCNPCPRALRVQLSDYRQRLPGSSVPVDSVFGKGNRGFLSGLSKINTVKFVSNSNKEVTSLRWDFSDGTSSQNTSMNYEFAQLGLQTVSLTVRTKGNCESVVINKVFVGGASGLFACGIAAELLQKNNSEFKANIIGGKAPFRYTWHFGDGVTSNLPSPSHNYQWIGAYPVKLRIEDAENHVCESNYIHIAGNDNSSCSANMSLSLAGSRNNSLNGGVTIQWTDESNVILSSNNIAQPAESYFEVINSQAYESNERGEAGRLLSLRFNVLLSDGNRQLWFKSESTAIAVTYK